MILRFSQHAVNAKNAAWLRRAQAVRCDERNIEPNKLAKSQRPERSGRREPAGGGA
jgi:hypothetical protein